MGKRRVIAVFLCLSLVFAFCPGIGKVEQAGAAAQEGIKIWEDTLGKVSETGYIPVNKKTLNEDDLHVGKKRMSTRRSVSIPASYDAREDGLTNEVRNQGVFGNCWAYAAMSASESNIIKKGYETQPDLSEYHLSYSAYNKALDPLGLTIGDVCRVREMNNNVYSWGGNAYGTIASLSRWQGIAEEEDAPLSDLFSAYENEITAIVPEDVLYKDSYHIQNAEFVYLSEDNRDLIKQKIMEYGSGTLSYYSGTDAENKRYSNTRNDNYTAYYCDDASKQTNHMVAVVGWDDNYAVSNFNASCRPAKPGAWLIRNSWGKYNNMGGYFWISYEDATLNEKNDSQAEVTFYDVEPAARYDYNYQYDTGLPLRYVSGFESIANVYQAQHNEKIEAVSFHTQERNVTYKIELYRVSDQSNPKSGAKLGETITGQCNERGYHTIDFSEMGMEDVYVAKGDMFSVILSLKNSDGTVGYYTIETISNRSGLEESVTGGTNQSFAYTGRSWTDLTQVNFTTQKVDANFCLKAFTSETTEIPTATPTPTPTPTPTATPTPTPTPTATPTPTSTSTATPTPTPTPTATPMEIPTTPVDIDLSESILRAESERGAVTYDKASQTLTGKDIWWFAVKLPGVVRAGQTVKMKVKGISDATGFRMSLTNAASDVCSSRISSIENDIGEGEFTWTFELTATQDADYLEFKAITYGQVIGKLIISKILLNPDEEDMPTATPIQTTRPTEEPTIGPTEEPTKEPTIEPTEEPTTEPTEEPTFGPTEMPTDVPTDNPTIEPTIEPTEEPTFGPTEMPTDNPTQEPTDAPTDSPTQVPTDVPTDVPTVLPTENPSDMPTFGPTQLPTEKVEPTEKPYRIDEPTIPPIIKKIKFSPSSKKVKAGKKLKLSRYLKITKNRMGSVVFKYEFTKKKYKKYASLTKKGVLKAKKKGRKKTIYVRVRALDGSLKTAKIKIKIK